MMTSTHLPVIKQIKILHKKITNITTYKMELNSRSAKNRAASSIIRFARDPDIPKYQNLVKN